MELREYIKHHTLYLDGGMESAKNFVLPFIESNVEKVIKIGTEDYKSRTFSRTDEQKGRDLSLISRCHSGSAFFHAVE